MSFPTQTGNDRTQDPRGPYCFTKPLNVLEFFSGIGLIHEALKPLGWQVVLANDNNAKKAASYHANFPETPFNNEDVRLLDVSGISPVEVATASFPCIDLSQAGGREGINGDKSGVVWGFLDRIADLHRLNNAPEFLFLENVPGLLSLHKGKSIDLLLQRIAELGYCFDLVQVDASHFLPQTRNRIFIIAVLGRDRFPRPQNIPSTHIRRYKVREVYQRNPHLPWIFFDFPPLPVRSIGLEDIVEPLPPDDARWWSETKMEYFWHHLEKHHGPKLKTLFHSSERKHLTAVRRLRRRGVREQIINLRFDGLASCLRTPKGGSSAQYIVEIEDGTVRVRRILGVETARLQGVCLPDAAPDFRLVGGETEQMYGFGDAVCVPAVRWVFTHSIETLRDGGSMSSLCKSYSVPKSLTLDLMLEAA
jgi:DNA (cytosine-5)-methyltransferase 1